jgi:hypothetical protein
MQREHESLLLGQRQNVAHSLGDSLRNSLRKILFVVHVSSPFLFPVEVLI